MPPKDETMKKEYRKNRLYLWLAILLVAQLSAQRIIDGEKMEVLENQVIVQNSHDAVWSALSYYGNVSSFH